MQIHPVGHKLLRWILWILPFLTAGQIQWTLYTLYHYKIYLYSPEGSVLSPALFTLHTDDCRSTDPDMFALKHSDDTVILDAFKRLLSAAGAFASCRKKQSPPSESIQNKRNGYGLPVKPPIKFDSGQPGL